MTALSLIASSHAFLTKTETIDGKVDSYLCDLKGERLGPNQIPFPIYRDAFTAKTFVRVAENIPNGNQTADKELAAWITSLNPTHYVSPDGDVKGYFIEAPDFNEREGKM